MGLGSKLRRFVRRSGSNFLRRPHLLASGPFALFAGPMGLGPELIRSNKGYNQVIDIRQDMTSMDGTPMQRHYGTTSRVPGVIIQMGPILRVVDDQGKAIDHADIAICWGEGPIALDEALPVEDRLTIWANGKIIAGQAFKSISLTAQSNIEVQLPDPGTALILSGTGGGTPDFTDFRPYFTMTFANMFKSANNGTFMVLNTGTITEGADSGRTFVVIQNDNAENEINLSTTVALTQVLPELTIPNNGLFSSVCHYDGTQTEPDEVLRRLVGTKLVPNYKGLCYTVFQKMRFVAWGNQIPNFTAEIRHPDVEGVPPEEGTLGFALNDILLQNNVDSSLFDTTGLTQQLRGYQSNQEESGEDIIASLAIVYRFKTTEFDGVVTFKLHSDSDEVAVEEKLLSAGVSSEGQTPRNVQFAAESPESVPRILKFGFVNPLNDYQRSEVTVKRNLRVFGQTANGVNPAAYSSSRTAEQRDTGVVLLPEEARIIATMMLNLTRENRLYAEFTLPPSQMDIEPGDDVDVTVGSIRYILRVERVERGANFVLMFRALAYQAERNSDVDPLPL